MRQTEPPPLARWMLEHCAAANCPDALAGDLLEEFRSGRSDSWYWRQTLNACAITWLHNLQARWSLVVVAFLWSTLGPALTDIVYRLDSESGASGAMWRMDGPFAEFSSFWIWLVLNISFVWAGILLYLSFNARFARALPVRKIARTLVLAVPLFLSIYLTTFVLMNLFAFPGPQVNLSNVAPYATIFDLRAWALVVRATYMLTILCALWRVAPQLKTKPWGPALLDPTNYSPLSYTTSSSVELDPYIVKRFLGFMVSAGLINAMIVGFMLCTLPDSHTPTVASFLTRAFIYVALGALAGVGCTWIYWMSPSSPFREHPPIPFALFALVCAAGWIWVPSMMLLLEQLSATTAFVAVIGASLLAVGLRNATSLVFVQVQRSSPSHEPEVPELFAETLYRSPREVQGYVIAICLYLGAFALASQLNLTAAAFLATGTFLFSWKRIFIRSHEFDCNLEYKRAARRLALTTIAAILFTAWVLLDGVESRNRVADMNATGRSSNATPVSGHNGLKSKSQVLANGIDGYESVILWPLPSKKKILPPLPASEQFLAPGTTRPLIIPFDGPYWYLQPPNKLPGSTAHQAHGTPLKIDIESHNSVPLVMDAHQSLSTSISVARCREIQVEIENRDNLEGTISIAVLLTDSLSTEKRTLYLGQQPVMSTVPGHFSIKREPILETLRFSVPAHANIRNFNEITVMILPDVEHELVGPKIAIQQFQLYPR